MHPCCWGNLFRELVQFLPFLAVLAVGLKQLFSPTVSLLKRLTRRGKNPALSAVLLQDETEALPSCCSSRAAD